MASQQQTLYTICMQTKDSLRRGEGDFVLKLGGDAPRAEASKVQLGSLEFPIVQWTIEEDWSRLYHSEGFRIHPEARRMKVEEERIVGETREETEDMFRSTEVVLPLYLNPIQRWSPLPGEEGWYKVTCGLEHGLWTEGGGSSLLSAIRWADVEIVCSAAGRLSLNERMRAGCLRYLSDTEFAVEVRCGSDLVGSRGYVYVPTVPSPSLLCDLISFPLSRAKTMGRYRVEYDPSSNTACLLSDRFPSSSSSSSSRSGEDVVDGIRFTLVGGGLSSLIGYPSSHSRRFSPREDSFGKKDDLPLRLPSEPFPGWSFSRLRPGWYSPSHRSMNTGHPLHISKEVELSLNPFYFPIDERTPDGFPTAHFFVFSDPAGCVQICPLLSGRYTSSSLSSYLSTRMSDLSSVPDTIFSVDAQEEDAGMGRFVFSCEVRDESGGIQPAPFSLLFTHPLQFNPERIGFQPIAYHGQSSYASSFPVGGVVSSPRPPSIQTGRNVYRFTETSHEKRFELHASPIAPLTCRIESYDVGSCLLTVTTFASSLPFVHGFRVGDIVRIAPCRKTTLLLDEEGAGWEGRDVSPCPLASDWGRSGVVSESGHQRVTLRVRSTPALSDCVGMCLQLNVDPEPVNLCFGLLPKSVKAEMLGFRKGSVQWGVDGSIEAGEWLVPPLSAPFIHSLDHPDYVLLYLREGKQSTTLQHGSGPNATAPFAKIVLYPLLREERMLPRDTSLLCESLNQFTLSVRNPDGSPYHFHGAEFSFSLNFVRS